MRNHNSLLLKRQLECLFGLIFPHLGAASPIRRSALPEDAPPIDTGYDAWAEALSGVGPLILLIGEKNTKQLLREANGIPAILSMALAPIGLLSVLTSMIRLCGSQSLRSYLGYEHEPRANSALEMTKANCAGIHAEVVDGIVSRKTVSDATSQALAVAYLKGSSEVAIQESLRQIQTCYTFQAEKNAKGCPESAGNVGWCFRVICNIDNSAAHAISRLILTALNIHKRPGFCHELSVLSQAVLTTVDDIGTPCPDEPLHGLTSAVNNESEALASSTVGDKKTGRAVVLPDKDQLIVAPEHLQAPSRLCDTIEKSSTRSPATSGITVSTSPAAAKTPIIKLPAPISSSFYCTFDGVSEVNTSTPTPAALSLTVATISFLSMLAIPVIALWLEGWFSIGITMVLAGYLSMVLGVTAGGYMVYTSCDSATLPTRQSIPEANWTYGLVHLVKNTDSLDTTGSRLMQAKGQEQVFEAVWLKKQGGIRYVLTWVISIFLTLAFVCYYLGLRSCQWWVSISQLLICLVSAFVRSMGKMDRGSFEIVDDIRLDKRCYSTGILDMQRATRISKKERTCTALDLRIYSLRSSCCLPLTGELVAWQAAKLCCEPEYQATGNKIMAVVGMRLAIFRNDDPLQRSLVAVFKGGVVTEEGLAFPNAIMAVAFASSMTELAAPTPFLARGIMRQPQWSLEQTDINKQTLPFMGGTYISSFDSLVTWWTIAEDRNDMGDQHKNLHGSFGLISIAFFLALLRKGEQDEEVIRAIAAAHKRSSAEDRTYASNLIQFLSTSLG